VAFTSCLPILWHLYILESGIDSKLAVDGSVVEYKGMVVGFSQAKGVDLTILMLQVSIKKRPLT
jgi:hypothetical protein